MLEVTDRKRDLRSTPEAALNEVPTWALAAKAAGARFVLRSEMTPTGIGGFLSFSRCLAVSDRLQYKHVPSCFRNDLWCSTRLAGESTMNSKNLVVLWAVSCLAGHVAVGQEVDKKKLAEFERAALKKEADGGWKKIDWAQDMEAALKKGKADSKPVLVVLVVGEKGKKGAAEC